tara:strand:- start:265 stop:576 length:312 start_codon:yes stop_codon:yes gene_type:complete
MEKVNFNKGVRIVVSPTDNGYACGIINEKENLDKGDESLYLCHVVAQGMIKFAIENPQDVFDLGFQQMAESKDNISNGKIKRFEEYDNIIDIVDLLKKNGKLN